MSSRWFTISIRALTLAVSISAAGSSARAGEIYYSFSFNSDGISGSGTLVTASVPDATAPFPDAYDILAIDGAVDGDPITGVLGETGAVDYSPDGFFIYDNVFYPAGSDSAAGGYFDDDGLLLTTAETNYNLFFDGTTYWYWQDQAGGTAVTFSATDPPPPIAEPSSLWLLSAMLAGWAVVRHRRASATGL